MNALLIITREPALLILAAASIASWTIIFDRLIVLFRLRGAAEKRILNEMRTELSAKLAGVSSQNIPTVIDAICRRERRKLETHLPLLGVIGSTAPYVGLFGTVIGIIRAFQSIQLHNDMSPSVVSGGIASALIATAAGLAVAIPAVAAHHLLIASFRRHAEAWEEILTVERLQQGKLGLREGVYEFIP